MRRPWGAHAGCAVLQASEWPGWWTWFLGEVRLEAVFKLNDLSDLRLRERGRYCDNQTPHCSVGFQILGCRDGT